MRKKYLFTVFILILGLLFNPKSGFTKAPNDITKVVIQLNGQDKKVIEGGFRNIEHIIEAGKQAKQELFINIVVFGPAMMYFTNKSPENFSDNMAKYKSNKHIKFFACKNTMKQMKINKEDLISGFTIIPSGAWEIIKLQKEGYQYFKP